MEHVAHHVLLASCEYELRHRAHLDFGAQESFNIFLRIFSYLLELVYRDNILSPEFSRYRKISSFITNITRIREIQADFGGIK